MGILSIVGELALVGGTGLSRSMSVRFDGCIVDCDGRVRPKEDFRPRMIRTAMRRLVMTFHGLVTRILRLHWA
jgi:hypothetical protein